MQRVRMQSRWVSGAGPRLGLVVPLVMLGLLMAQAVAAGPRRTVAILPIVVNATEERDFLRSGLADMLASRLGQEEGVAVMRLDDPKLATTNAAEAQEAAKKAGADFVLFGSFTRFGDGASLDVNCLSTKGDVASSKAVFVQAGTLGDIIPRLDNLSKRVAHHVRGGAASRPASGAGADVGDALSELDALRSRVEALERQVFSEEEGGDSGDTAAR